MGNYGNDRSGGSRYGGGGGGYRRDSGNRRDFGGDRDRGPKEMFKTICDECGKSCEVPFRPSGDKPVYCSDCFNLKNDRDGGRPERRDFDRNERPERGESRSAAPSADNGKILEKLNELNTKFEKLLNVLEALTVDEDEDDSDEEVSEVEETPVVEEPKKEKKTRAKKTDVAVDIVAE
jgi:CxxC-x17-CxxC domain-containing protein